MVDPAACRQAARLLADVAHERRRLVVAAQDGWSGPHRDAFDEADALLQRRARELTEQLLLRAAVLEAEPCTPR